MLVRRLRGAVGASDAAVHRHQRHARRPRHQGRATPAGRRVGHPDLRHRHPGRTTSSARPLRRATVGRHGPGQRSPSRLASPTPAELGRAAQPTRWPSGPSSTFGLREDDEGKLARQPPTRLQRPRPRRSHDETGVGRRSLRGAAARPPAGRLARPATTQGRPLFAFKLHQFIGKGDTVYVTLEPPEDALPDHAIPAQRTRRARRASRCSRWRSAANAARTSSSSTSSAAARASAPASSTAIAASSRSHRSVAHHRQALARPNDPALLDLVPDDWVIDRRQRPTARQGAPNRLPAALRVDEFGTITDDGMPVAFFERLDFCPSCKTSYESAQQSEFSRVASLGTEGRASAVTVLSQVGGARPAGASRPRRRGPKVPGLHRQPPGRQPAGRPFQRLRARRPGALGPVPRRPRPPGTTTPTSRSPTRTSDPGWSRRSAATLEDFAQDEDTADEPVPAQEDRPRAARRRHLPAVGRSQARLAHHDAQPRADRTAATVLLRASTTSPRTTPSGPAFGQPLAGAEPETRRDADARPARRAASQPVHRIGVPHRGEVRQHQAGQPGVAEGSVGADR